VRRQEGQLSTPCKRALARTNDSRPRINFCRAPSAYGINKAQMTGLDRRTILVFVILITLLGLALRLYRLANQSLWMDEISSVETARVPLDQIIERSAQNNASPAYFLLLRPIVGKSNGRIEARARILSAIAGALSIPVFIGVVLHWRKDWATALTAGVLLAINPLHVWYSQEVRGYAIMLFFGLCA